MRGDRKTPCKQRRNLIPKDKACGQPSAKDSKKVAYFKVFGGSVKRKKMLYVLFFYGEKIENADFLCGERDSEMCSDVEKRAGNLPEESNLFFHQTEPFFDNIL